MARISASFDPKMIEAEEHLLIDLHFLIQEMMSARGISRTELAEKAGISRARLSQILSNEANPTVKSMARLFYALGEKICVSRMAHQKICSSEKGSEWHWTASATGEIRVDEQLVAVVKDTGASNDNYGNRFVFIDSDLSLEAA
jgi:transcriptional regulator with XRE-family HTH domain